MTSFWLVLIAGGLVMMMIGLIFGIVGGAFDQKRGER